MLLDIVVIIALISCMVYGYKKGLIKVVSKIVSIVIALVLAYLLAKSVGQYIQNKTTLGNKANETIKTNITKILKDKDPTQNNAVIKSLEEIVNMNVQNTKDMFAERITDYIFIGIGFEIVYILVRLVLWGATIVLDKMSKLPLLKPANKLLGMAFAIVLGFLEICVVLSIIYFLSAFEFMKGIVGFVNSSIIAGELYEHNIVTNIIQSIIT